MNKNEEVDLPLWKCHKVVGASRILYVERYLDRARHRLVLECGVRVGVPDAWAAKHKPAVNGYFLLHEDGYESYSPAEAFEAGYTPLAFDEETARREAGMKKDADPRQPGGSTPGPSAGSQTVPKEPTKESERT